MKNGRRIYMWYAQLQLALPKRKLKQRVQLQERTMCVYRDTNRKKNGYEDFSITWLDKN